jgi:iron(III) transport system substrate-binding protein
MPHILRSFAAVMVAVATLLAGCGGSESSSSGDRNTASQAFTYSASDRDAYLTKCAAEEGSLTWYTSLAGDVIDAMIKAFNEKHPGVKVETYRGEQTDVVSRVYQESQTDRLQGDVVEVTSDGFRQLAEMKTLGVFSSPVTAGASERFTLKDADGGILGIGDRASYVSFAYNTDKLPESAVPRALEDLLNPALNGKIALTDSTTGVRFIGNVLQALGDEKGRDFLTKLAAQNLRIEAVSGSALAGMIATGEVTSSPGIFRNHAAQETVDGAPVKWVPLQPVTANVGYAGVFANSAHPCASMLFLDTLLGSTGGQVYEGLQYPRPSDDLGFTSWVPDETFKTTDEYNEAFKTWSSLFEENFR